MPERKYKGFRIDCEEVQGKGAYIHLARPSYEHIKAAQQSGELDNFDVAIHIIGSLADDWNWVDDNGNQLPPPTEKTLRELPLQEQNFLVRKFNELNQEEEKN